MNTRILLIDNYDSFTYNLVQAFAVLGAEVEVYRNDAITVDDALALAPDRLVVSPGPGRPEGAGRALELLGAFVGHVPVLGVCLGLQSLVSLFGGRIVHARELMHGKSSPVHHDGRTVFQGLPQPFEAGRYHSLAAEAATLPDVFAVTARTGDGEIMGIRHRSLAVEGVQFHPESILTPQGPELLRNFLNLPAGGDR